MVNRAATRDGSARSPGCVVPASGRRGVLPPAGGAPTDTPSATDRAGAGVLRTGPVGFHWPVLAFAICAGGGCHGLRAGGFRIVSRQSAREAADALAAPVQHCVPCRLGRRGTALLVQPLGLGVLRSLNVAVMGRPGWLVLGPRAEARARRKRRERREPAVIDHHLLSRHAWLWTSESSA